MLTAYPLVKRGPSLVSYVITRLKATSNLLGSPTRDASKTRGILVSSTLFVCTCKLKSETSKVRARSEFALAIELIETRGVPSI